MPEENFSSLIPQQGDTPEILRMKLGVAAGRLAALVQDDVSVDLAALRGAVESLVPLAQQLAPLPVAPRCWQFYRSADPQPFIDTPTYFRKGYFWAASLTGTPTVLPIRLYYGGNGNRVILPGQMAEFEAPAGQMLNLQDFRMAGGYFYYDVVSVELY